MGLVVVLLQPFRCAGFFGGTVSAAKDLNLDLHLVPCLLHALLSGSS